MSININARKYERLRELQYRREAHRNQELRGHLRAAIKMSGKRINTLDVLDISPAAQIELLEDYAAKLEDEAADFLNTWPGKDGQYAARRFRMERGHVLKQIVRLKISAAQGENPG